MSSGLYTHRTRNAGEIVDAPMYNGAHQNQLQNDIPNEAGAHSDTLTQFRATQDPNPGGTPNQVAALADEIEQLRFEVADIKTALNAGTPLAQWYTPVSVVTSTIAAKGARIQRTTNSSIAINSQAAVSFTTVVYDTGATNPVFDPFFSAGTPTRLTARVSGLYEVIGYLQWSTGAAGPAAAYIRRNGTQILSADEYSISGTEAADLYVAAQYELAQGDYVELLAYQNVTNPYTLTSATFELQLLNPTAVIPPPPVFTLSITESGSGTGAVTSDHGGINCPGTCSVNFTAGDTVILTATPSAGTFIAWTGVPVGHETDNPVSVPILSNLTVNAQFSLTGQASGYNNSFGAFTGTRFASLTSNIQVTVSESAAQWEAPSAVTFTKMYVVLPAALAGGHSMTFQMSVNGTPVSSILTIGAGAIDGNVAISVPVNQKDLISIKIVQTGGGGDTFNAISLLYTI